MKWTIEQRIFLIEHVFRAGDKYTQLVKQLFMEKFPDTNVPHRDTVRDLIDKFRRTGSVADEERSGRPSRLSEEKIAEISNKMAQSPTKSIRRLSQETDLSKTTVHKALRCELRLFPYKITAMHQLQNTDYEKRSAYCTIMQDFISTKGEEVLDITFFTDEAWFYLSGAVNSQNSRIWSAANPYEFHESPLHDQKIGVWLAISRSRIVGPIFFEETINSERYCTAILQPFVNQLSEFERQNGYFQQDGATAHTSNQSMRFLSDVFDDRIISKGIWPPRSPDLSPPDFYVWGAAKANVYKDRPQSIQDLRMAITNYVSSIPQATLLVVSQNMQRRIGLCLTQKGHHFQHML